MTTMTTEDRNLIDLGLAVVAEFHSAFGIPQPDRPTLPAEKVQGALRLYVRQAGELARRLREESERTQSLQLLRLHLIQEELSELAEGMLNEDPVECLDALLDLSYVVDGTYLALGMAALKEPGLREVHRSNMSKLGPDGKPIIGPSGRVQKGPNYSPPDLKGLFDEETTDDGGPA